MAKYIGPVCRLCRREKQKLFLKGERCYLDKCSFERKGYPPGEHGSARKSGFSEYGLQLREKQKVKRTYGILERQFKRFFKLAVKKRGVVSERFFQILELRLDNVIYRMGFARTRKEARQIVRHNHVLVNDSRLNIPSALLSIDDKVSISSDSQGLDIFKLSKNLYDRRGQLSWFEVDHNNFNGKIIAYPTRDDIQFNVKERLIVELYSRIVGA